MLQQQAKLDDLGIRLHTDSPRGYLAMETDSILIDPVLEQAALAAAEAIGTTAYPILTYLANRIVKDETEPPNPSPRGSADTHAGSPNRQSSISNPQPSIPNPQSPIPNRPSPIQP